MEPLFKNKTTLSKENYLALVKFHQKKNNWKYYIYTAFFSILFVLIISFQLANHHYLQVALLLTLFIAFLAYRFFYPFYKTSKEYHSSKVQQNLVNYYFFYDKYFKVKNKMGNAKLKYYKLYKVYENDNYFYLYVDKLNAFIIDKSGFTLGTVDNFRTFIKGKVWFKFKGN